jgi:osmotically-inducible protein OsmY
MAEQNRGSGERGRGYGGGWDDFARRGEYDADARGRGDAGGREQRSFGDGDPSGARYGRGEGRFAGSQEAYGGQWGRGGSEGQGYGRQSYGEPRGQGYGGQGYGATGRGWNEGRGSQGYGGRGDQERGLAGGSDYAGQGGYGLSHDYERGQYRGSQAYGAPYGDDPGGQEETGHRGFLERAGEKIGAFFGRDQQGHRGRGPKNYTRSDERIREDVNDRLTDDPFLDASGVEVQVTTCEVTLTGTVDSREDKRRAEDIAEQVSGVRHVQNNLRVQPQSAWSQDAASTTSASGALSAGSGTTGSTGAAGVDPGRATGSASGASPSSGATKPS